MKPSPKQNRYFSNLFKNVLVVASCHEKPEKMLVCFHKRSEQEMDRAIHAFEAKYGQKLEKMDLDELGEYCGYWFPILVYGPTRSNSEKGICHVVSEGKFLNDSAADGIISYIQDSRNIGELKEALLPALKRGYAIKQQHWNASPEANNVMKLLYKDVVLVANCKERPDELLVCFNSAHKKRMLTAVHHFEKKYNCAVEMNHPAEASGALTGCWLPKKIRMAEKIGQKPEHEFIPKEAAYLENRALKGAFMFVQSSENYENLDQKIASALQRNYIATHFPERN